MDKGRDTTDPNGLFDSVRGVGVRLQSNSTAAEFTSTNYLSTFDSDGFIVELTVNTMALVKTTLHGVGMQEQEVLQATPMDQ